jgi:hypothetical protein
MDVFNPVAAVFKLDIQMWPLAAFQAVNSTHLMGTKRARFSTSMRKPFAG